MNKGGRRALLFGGVALVAGGAGAGWAWHHSRGQPSQPQTDILLGTVVRHWPFHFMGAAQVLGHLLLASAWFQMGPALTSQVPLTTTPFS